MSGWYVVVETDRHTIALGPYATEAEAVTELQSESGITECLVTVDAKRDGYVVEDAYVTDDVRLNAEDVQHITPDSVEWITL